MCASQNTPVYINYPIYRTKGIMWKRPVVKNSIYSNGDIDL